MKILVGILIFLAVVIGIIAIIPAFIDPEASVSRSIEINKPVDVVYNVVKDYTFYQQWNPWSQMDPNAKNEISGPIGEVGSTWSWEGNPDSVGTGKLTIVELVPNTSIKAHLEFIVPFESEADDLWKFEAIDSTSTFVTWTYSGTADSYFIRYFNLGMESTLGPQQEKGLENLKELIEAMPAQPDSVMSESMTTSF